MTCLIATATSRAHIAPATAPSTSTPPAVIVSVLVNNAAAAPAATTEALSAAPVATTCSSVGRLRGSDEKLDQTLWPK